MIIMAANGSKDSWTNTVIFEYIAIFLCHFSHLILTVAMRVKLKRLLVTGLQPADTLITALSSLPHP